MALDYHTAQEDFTFIVEKLPPMFLANFVMWLDLKVAEYKVFGQMVLDDRKKNSNTRYKNLNRRPGIFNINNPEVHTTNNTNTGDHQTVKTHRASSFTNSRKLGKINTGQKMLQRHVVTHFIPDNSHSVPQTVDSGSPKMRLELQKSFPADTESLKSPPINKHVASSSWSLSNPKSVTSANALEVNHTYNGSEQMPVSLGDESLVLKVEPDFKDQTSCMMEVGQGCENQGDITPVFISDESVTGAINSWNEVDLKQVDTGNSADRTDMGTINLDNYFRKGRDERMELLREMRQARKKFPFRSKCEHNFKKAVDSVLSIFPFLCVRRIEVEQKMGFNSKSLRYVHKMKKQKQMQERRMKHHQTQSDVCLPAEPTSAESAKDYIIIKTENFDTPYS
ncbi:hypothetical protein ScPMuIL_011966 [Solemya velum]